MKRSRFAAYLLSLVSASGAGCGLRSAQPADAGGCGTYLVSPIDVPTTDAGTCSTLCAEHGCPTGFCNLSLDTNDQYVLTCSQEHTGRRPAGLVHARSHARDLRGRYFANAAYLEAASVPAFRQLAKELRTFGAPVRLSRAAERSAVEEIGHARLMARFARTHGATVPPVVMRPRPRRSLEAFARDNAIEGCVKETYGAVIALHQSLHATDRDVREAMGVIAADECRHAELAWQIDKWAARQLSAAACARVENARRLAARRLQHRELRSGETCWTKALGLPQDQRRRAMTDQLLATIWRA